MFAQRLSNIAIFPEWRSKYPPPGSTPQQSLTPKAWLDALAAAVAAGKIPNIPVAKAMGDMDHPANPAYPTGTDGTSPQVCTTTLQCRDNNTIYDGPAGTYGVSFDDGPLAVSLRIGWPLDLCLI